jgi:hypothetical protein
MAPIGTPPAMVWGMTTRATVQSIETFADASGAPAVVRYGRHTFAIDTLGEIKQTLIAEVYCSRRERKIAADACRRAYVAARSEIVDADWLARNLEMYA